MAAIDGQVGLVLAAHQRVHGQAAVTGHNGVGTASNVENVSGDAAQVAFAAGHGQLAMGDHVVGPQIANDVLNDAAGVGHHVIEKGAIGGMGRHEFAVVEVPHQIHVTLQAAHRVGEFKGQTVHPAGGAKQARRHVMNA